MGLPIKTKTDKIAIMRQAEMDQNIGGLKMSDLIIRNALRDALYEADAVTMRGVSIINQFPPAVDAVQVVRCKDCEWWHEDDDIGYCENPDGLDNYAHPDDFCSHGERR